MTPATPQPPIISTSALARHLGLSRWTVSRVLNGHPDVKPETSRRVREAMAELGFSPSPVGRALCGARTGMVGVCFQALGSPIVARKIASLQSILRQAGFRALFEVTDGRPDIELEVVRHFAAMRVDGLVLVGGMTPENAAAITSLVRERHTPAVLVDPLQRFELPTVELDRRQGVRLALEHLSGLGHRRFALLGIDEHVLYGRVRWQAIHQFVKDRSLSWEEHVTALSEPKPPGLNFAYGSRLAERLLALARRPTAIFALNDQVAIGAMSRLQRAGLQVPRDISLIGFDNLEVSAHVSPRLTTVDQRVEELMTTAVELLSEQCITANCGEPVYRAVPALFVPGESTGPAPVAVVENPRAAAPGEPVQLELS